MGNPDKVNELLRSAETDLEKHRLDPLSFEETAENILNELYAPAGEYGPSGSKKSQNPHSPYKRIAMFLFDKGYISSAIDVLVERWE